MHKLHKTVFLNKPCNSKIAKVNYGLIKSVPGVSDICGCNQTLLKQYIKELKPGFFSGAQVIHLSTSLLSISTNELISGKKVENLTEIYI
jgi:hypothetical protein